MRKILLLVSLLALLVPTAGQAQKDHTFGSNSIDCGEDGTISWTPTTLWPPNHKLHDITITYSDSDESASLTITPMPHSDVIGEGEEATERNGSGNTPFATDSSGGTDPDDGDGEAVVTGTARGERSGQAKEGRTYSFGYMAEDGGTTDGCSGPDMDPETDDEIIVFVPHDCRAGACKPS
jgi:hypothetical protein